MPKRGRTAKKDRSSKKHRKTDSYKRSKSKSQHAKNRNYGDNWYIWRQHLNDTKEANQDLEFWEVLVLASDTYDAVNHRPMVSWGKDTFFDFE